MGSAQGEFKGQALPPPSAPPKVTPDRPRWLLPAIGGGVLLLLVVVLAVFAIPTGGGGGNDELEVDGDTLRGIAMLLSLEGDVAGSWDDCEGTNGYDDFSAGARLSVTGKEGEIVGSGDVTNIDESMIPLLVDMDRKSDVIGLEASDDAAAEAELREFLAEGEGMLCMLYFEADIEMSDYYAVELASRGDLSYSRTELQDQGFVVGVTLGDL